MNPEPPLLEGQSPPTPSRPHLRELLPRHLPALARYVRQQLRRTLQDQESASDLVASVCGDLLGEDTPFEYRSEREFLGWLRAVVGNKVRERLRRLAAVKRGANRTVAATDSVLEAAHLEPASPSQDAMRREDLGQLDAALAQLPPDYREVILQVHLLGRCHAEVAAAMGRSVDATRTLLMRAKARLAGVLDRLQRHG